MVGFQGADDAAAVRINNGKLLVQTVDFFTPVVDSPYDLDKSRLRIHFLIFMQWAQNHCLP